MRKLLPTLSVLLAAGPAAELPVREVILYKSGVGYFERQGQLGAGESARLDFKGEEMNDVLKSLAINDLSGGKVTGLRYDSSEPLDKKLGEFPFKLGEKQSLSGFMDQVKGAEIDLKTGMEAATGTVVAARIVAAGSKDSEREQLVLMLGTGELRTFDLSSATSLKFRDPSLQLQLKDYLTSLSQARNRDKRSVYIDSSDATARNIAASYMVPAPVWKSSYRLIFGEKVEPTLEGWAIVENTTGDDWTKVTLAVVSGRPVSFISKLYEPKFLERPTVELPEDRAAIPVLYEGGFRQDVLSRNGTATPAPGPPPPAAEAALGGPIQGFARLQKPKSPIQVESATQSVMVTPQSTITLDTEGRDLGELFEYRFSTPVTVKKNESAMLPFLQQSVDARKLLIYRDDSGLNPMSAAEIANSTGKTLDGGPITVFDGKGYSGEALVETLKTGDKRLISYAVDLGTRVTTKFDSTADTVREIHLNHGTLTTKLASEETKTYTIRNVDSKAKTLIIEHPQRADYRVLNQKPIERTPSAYRFEVKLAPDSTGKFAIEEERVYSMSFAVTNLAPDVLMAHVQNKNLPEASRKQLQQIADQKKRIAETDSEVQQADSALTDTSNDEQRIRQNIDSLRRVQGQEEQVNKYASQLATQENQIAGLRDKLSLLKKDRARLQSELDASIDKLEF